MFIADSAKHMMFELYHNKDYAAINYDSVSHITLHVAFAVDDVHAAKDILVAAGAKVADDITKTPGGDTVLMLRDPWGLPIQFVKRVKPMLN